MHTEPPRGLGLALGVMLFAVGTVPYVLAPHACPDHVFTGVLGNWTDTKQHVAFIAHYRDHLVIDNVLTTEEHPPFLLNLWFWLGAQIGRAFGGAIAGWHALRLIGLLVFSSAATSAVWRYAPAGRRALALTLCCATLSVAWFVPGASTIDGNTIRYVVEQPQLSASAGLCVYGFLAIHDWWEQGGGRMPWRLVAIVVALWLVHPFEFWSVMFGFAIATTHLVRVRALAAGGAVRFVAAGALMSLPAAVFVALDLRSGGALHGLRALHGDAWPAPWDLLANLGLPLVVAAPVALRDAESRRLTAWLVGTWIALYLPGAPWRWHQVNGLQVCVALLAVRARWLPAGWRTCVAVVIASLALHAPYFAELVEQATTCETPAFLDPDLDAALASLPADARVVARPIYGLDIATRSPARPYFSAVRKSLDWQVKRNRCEAILDGDQVPGEDVTHVLCRDADPGCDARFLDMSEVFAAGDVHVFRR